MQSEQQQRIMGYFIEEAKDHLNTIEQGLLNLQSTIKDPEMASEVFRAAHSVKGGAAMLGLNGIQQTAHRLEDYFKILKECPIRVDQKLESLLLRVFDNLQELLEQLQGPFGLTDDKANEMMAEVEPVFTSLNEHLSVLVNQSGSTPPDDVDLTPISGAAPASATPKAQPVAAREESALQLIFQSDIPARLRDMLQLFKQSDDVRCRQQLQDICRSLAQAGEQFELPSWCELLRLTERAIAHLDNSYRTLAPIVITEIKQAQELVLRGRSAEISVSERLQALVPAPPPEDEVDDEFTSLLAELDITDPGEPEFIEFRLEQEDQLTEAAGDLPALDDDASLGDDWFGNFTLIQEDNNLPDLDFGLDEPDSDRSSTTTGMGFGKGQDTPPPPMSDQNGPEVGIAELNSLADLFEGEVPDLGMTWQQEEIVGDSSTELFQGDGSDLDVRGDFADLLDDQDGLDDLELEQEDDLSGLLNNSSLASSSSFGESQESDVVQTNAIANGGLEDLGELFATLDSDDGPNTTDNTIYSLDINTPLDLDPVEVDRSFDAIALEDPSFENSFEDALNNPAPFDGGTGDVEAELNLADDPFALDDATVESDPSTFDASTFDDSNLEVLEDSAADDALIEALIQGNSDAGLLEEIVPPEAVFSSGTLDPWADLDMEDEVELAAIDTRALNEPDMDTDLWGEHSEPTSISDAGEAIAPSLDTALPDFMSDPFTLDDPDVSSTLEAELGMDDNSLASSDLFEASGELTSIDGTEEIDLAVLLENDTDPEQSLASSNPLDASITPIPSDVSDLFGSGSTDFDSVFEADEPLDSLLGDESLTQDADLSTLFQDEIPDLTIGSDDSGLIDEPFNREMAPLAEISHPLDYPELSEDQEDYNLSENLFEINEDFDLNVAASHESNAEPAEPDTNLFSFDLNLESEAALSPFDEVLDLELDLDADAIASTAPTIPPADLQNDVLVDSNSPFDDLAFATETLATETMEERSSLDSPTVDGETEDDGAESNAAMFDFELGADEGSSDTAMFDFEPEANEGSSDAVMFDFELGADEGLSDAVMFDFELVADEGLSDTAMFDFEPEADEGPSDAAMFDFEDAGILTDVTIADLEVSDDTMPSDAAMFDFETEENSEAAVPPPLFEGAPEDDRTDSDESIFSFEADDDVATTADFDSSLAFIDFSDLSLNLDDVFSDSVGSEADPATALDLNMGMSNPYMSDLTESNNLGDLDTLLSDDMNVSDIPTTGIDDTDDSDVFEDLDAFAELDALLDDETIPTSNIAASAGADIDEFADLETLLGQVGTSDLSSEVTTTQSKAKPSDGGSEFDDLEKLLEDADQTLGGSPTTRGARGPSLAASRGKARPTRSVLSDQTMRVSVKNLDNLNNLVGELVVNRNSLEQAEERLRQFLDNLLYQVQQLSDVGQRMRDLYERSLLESSLLSSRKGYHPPQGNSGFNPSPPSNHATGASFDALEMDRFTGFHTLSQEMIELIVRVRESASDIDFVVDETDQVTRNFRQITTQLQEGLTRSRMVPFAQTADRLPRAVRDISIKCGKQAELVIEGRETLIDKMILEQLYDPMTHLVNNAITHGIEPPEERIASNKAPMGRITVRTFHQGNQTVISVTDDGAGIDPDNVKRKAVEKGLITPADSESMSRLDVYDLLFHHGFSTKDKADDFAGRGVGMDVVRTSLNEIRGVINIDSTIGRGTTFTIRLPLTLSISKALCCISNRARIAFPMDGVEDMLDVPKERIQINEQGRPCIQWRDQLLPFQPLSELLRYSRSLGRGSVYGGNQEDDIVSVVVLRSNAGNFLALQVDQVLGEQEIVIKQLEGPIPKPVGVAGATVLGDGRIMPIADVLELIDLSMGRLRRESGSSLWDKGEDQGSTEPADIKHEPTVLIVDDSITVRELLSMTFSKVGYRVEQARDGQEAWEKLRSGLPCDIVFCDIEMPRMDGLELLSRIQKDPSLSHLPIAMLTSRGADRHRQMAVQLGAKGYFTKPYLEEALLDAAQRMLKGEVLVAGSGS